MNAGEDQIGVYQPNEIVRLKSGRMLVDNWAKSTFNLFTKKRKGAINLKMI